MFASFTTSLLSVSLAVVAALVLLQAFVIIELLKQMSQVRYRLNLDDRPMMLSLAGRAGAEVLPSTEIREAFSASNGTGILLLLSTDCLNCRSLATELGRAAPNWPDFGFALVIQGRDSTDSETLVEDTGLQRELVTIDSTREIAAQVGIAVRPAAVVVREWRMVEAATITSASQLEQLAAALVVEPASSYEEAAHALT